MSASKKKLARRQADLTDVKLTEKQKREQKEAQVKKRNTILAAIAGVVVVALVAALLIWRSGIVARHSTALTVKDHNFSVADMNYYYHMAINTAYNQDQQMAQFYAQLGQEYTPSFDPQKDLKTQYVDEAQTTSFHDQFLENAKSSAAEIAALYDAAQAAGYTLSDEGQETLDQALSSLDSTIQQYNYGSRDAYLKAAYGRSMTEKVYLRNLEQYILATDFYTATTGAMGDYSSDELNAYYEENPNLLDSYNYNYAFIDGSVPTTDSEGNTVEVTDQQKADAMAEAKSQASNLMDAVRLAEKNGASDTAAASKKWPELDYFSQAAQELTVSSTVRENVMGSSFSSATYGKWLMDSARVDGDMDMFEVENSGYYVIQFHGRARDDSPTADVRHILFSTALTDDPETTDVNESTQTPSDERVAEVKARAEEILNQFNQGEKTGEAFGALAEQYSEDGRNEEGGLSAAGGLYKAVKPTDNYVPEFLDWIFADGRQVGDTGLVQTTYGWHIMYYDGFNDPAWMAQAATDKKSADQTNWINSVKEGYDPVESSAFSQVGA